MLENKKIFLLLALFFGFLLMSFNGFGETLTVCKSGCKYRSIQDAIYASDTGDLIRIEPGKYEENLEVSHKKLTFEGVKPGEVIIQGTKEDYDRPVLLVGPSGAEATLNNITVKGHDGYSYACVSIKGEICPHGISVVGDSIIKVNNSIISGSGRSGIRLKENSHGKITNSEIVNSGLYGIHVTGSAQAQVTDNLIQSNSKIGILNRSEKKVTGTGNEIRGNTIGLVGNLSGELREKFAEAGQEKIILPDDKYSTLQQAVDALQPGGTILLSEGNYKGAVVVGKEVKLEAVAGKVLVGKEEQTAFSIVGNGDLSIIGLTVASNQPLVLGNQGQAKIEKSVLKGPASVKLYNSSRITFFESEVLNNHIELHESSSIEISKSSITDMRLYNSSSGVITDSEVKGRCQLQDTSNIIAKNSQFTNPNSEEYLAAFWIDDKASAELKKNDFSNTGIALYNFGEASVINNSINDNNGPGIYLNGDSAVTVNTTRISHCEEGIEHDSSGKISIIDSIITSNGLGVDLLSSEKTVIKDSLIAGNKVGISLYTKSHAHLVNNRIVDNDLGFKYYGADKLTGYGNNINNKVDIDENNSSGARIIRLLSRPGEGSETSEGKGESNEGEKSSTKTKAEEIIYEQNFDQLSQGVHSIRINRSNYFKANEISEAGRLDDFTLELDVKEAAGKPAGYGVVFRKSSKRKFYVFVLSNTGMFKFARQTSDNWRWEDIVDWTKSSDIKKGSRWNHLKVVAGGSRIELYANGELLHRLTDPRLKRGNIALMATTGKSNPSVNVLFDNLAIYKE